ncbi:MAG: hypothetical protein ACTSPP_04850 [Candidatus Heimdallarchaeaceae archaeon]
MSLKKTFITLYISNYMQVYHVVKKELKELKSPYTFLDGDVYVVETDNILWVWIGKRSYADDKAVGAWAAKVIEEKNKKLEIKTIMQGDEPPEFLDIIEFEVKRGDTPGFLKHIDIKVKKDFRLLHIEQNEKGEVITKEIPIEYKLFESDDAFVLDFYDEIYIWIGKDCQVKEKYEAGKIARQLEVERKRIPIVYVIEEGDEPEGFRDMITKMAWRDAALELRNDDKKEDSSKKKKWWQFWK